MHYTRYCLGEQISSTYTPITQTEIESGNYNYILEWESKDNKSKVQYRAEEYNNEKARVMEVLEEYYNVFIGYLEEKHEGKYYLYSETYGYVKPKGTNGSFYYNMSSNLVENMDYKKAYCLARTIGRDIEIKAVPKREYKPTQKQIAEEFGMARTAITAINNGKNWYDPNIDYPIRKTNRQKKPILQIDVETNEVIHEYASIAEATKAFGKTSNVMFSRALNGTNKTAYGFIWKYKE